MTTLRGLTLEEIPAYNRLSSACFTYPVKTEALTPKEMPPERLREYRGVFDGEGRLLGAMIQLSMDARFEGHTCKLLGIGGVATDPAQRRHGAIRQLFEEGLPRLYDEGFVFSALYPFSHVFYRKFGYELGILRRNAEVKTTAIRRDLRPAASIRLILPDEPDGGMRDVYAQYIAGKNLAVCRREDHWKALREGAPWESLKYSYVLYDGAQRPMAYWIGTAARKDDCALLTIKDMAYTSRAGLEAIFAMLRTMNEIECIRLTVPQDVELRFLVTDPYEVKETVSCGGMVRVMNAERALGMLPAPVVPGQVVIEVQDGQIPQNCSCFTVTGDGTCLTVTRGGEPDLRCGIGGLSALVMGTQDFEGSEASGLAELLHPEKRPFLAMLFRQRKSHLHDYF